MFEHYVKLLDSENYVTRRQSLKLLGELLLDRANFTIMTKYISNPENLKLMMNMLRDKSKNIQFEAFHVFKVRMRLPKGKPHVCVDPLGFPLYYTRGITARSVCLRCRCLWPTQTSQNPSWIFF